MHHDQQPPPALSSSGLRRITPPMLRTMKAADAFRSVTGLLPGKVLAAFKAAAPFLGFRLEVVGAIDWLFKFTQPLDWEPGSRPIVWPSAAEQRDAFGLSAAQVKYLNRQLAELGLVVMRDSPNGRRYGTRTHGKTGTIVDAYGFDLSPLAIRMGEFQAIAAEGKARKIRMKALRRRATIARNSLRQLFAIAIAENPAAFDAVVWQRRAELFSRGLADITDEGVLTMAVASLERIRDEARESLDQCFSDLAAESKPVETYPKGSENPPHITTTNELLNPTDTVNAHGRTGAEYHEGLGPKHEVPYGRHRAATALKAQGRYTTTGRPDVGPDGAVMKMTPEELTRLAPKLRFYLPRSTATWTDIVEAADWLRGDLGISEALWGDACLALGRHRAAVAVAIVSAKPDGYFRAGPGAYLFGMLRRAKFGELRLAKTVCGLRAKIKYGVPVEMP